MDMDKDMDPDLGAVQPVAVSGAGGVAGGVGVGGLGLRDTRNGIHDPPSHPSYPRHPSRLDDHGPSSASVSYSNANHTGVVSSSASATATDLANARAHANDTDPQVLAHHDSTALGPDEPHNASLRRASSPNTEAESLPMPTSSLPLPTLRSNNGEDTFTRHLPVQLPATNTHNTSRQNLRSISNPLDLKSAVVPRSTLTGQPSVRDLKKRFDQNSTALPTQNTLPSRQHVPTRLRQDPSRLKPQANLASNTSPRVGLALQPSRETQTTSSSPIHRSQRPQYVAQDQVSNTSQSFASRIANPRTTTNGNPIISKSMTHLPRRSTPETASPIPPPPPQPSPPKPSLKATGFSSGEISSEEHGILSVGLDIPKIRPRRTSDSSVHGILARRGSFTNIQAKPASSSNWDPNASAEYEAEPKVHARSQSDISAPNPPQIIARKPLPKISLPSTPHLPAPSRLPVPIRRLNSPATSSASSTRSSSPSARNQSQEANGTTASKASPQTPGTKTPVGCREPPSGLNTPVNKSRLQAYIAERPPKLSPPLRSSRPRQPISMTSAMSSRMKEMGRGKSITYLGAKDPLSQSNDAERHRRISVGLIDFEQRREHIRLAYTKSISESQAFEGNQKMAVEKRREEMETPEKEKASPTTREDQTPTKKTVADISGITSVLDIEEEDEEEEREEEEDMSDESRDCPAEDPKAPSTSGLLASKTNNSSPLKGSLQSLMSAAALSILNTNSPTLGMPGSFPDFDSPVDNMDRPFSMVSTTTEFDIEPQIEPSVSAESSSSISITFTQPMTSQTSPPIQTPVDHCSFGDELLSPTQLPARTNGQGTGNPGPMSPPSRNQAQFSGLLDARIPFPRLDTQDDSDCVSDIESVSAMEQNGCLDFDSNAVDCTDEAENGGNEERPSTNNFGHHAPASRLASTCASPDIETFDDLLYPSSYDKSSSYEPSSRLAVPSSRFNAERMSRQSAWTDFSIESSDHSDASNSPTTQVAPYSYNHPAHLKANLDAKEPTDNRGVTSTSPPLESKISPSDASGRSIGLSHRRKPPGLDLKHGFATPYLSTIVGKLTSYPPSPSHEPPPVPTPGLGSLFNSRTSSVLYEQSQYGSTLLNSERESGEFPSHLETPRSLDTTSIETGDHYFDKKAVTAENDAKSLSQDKDSADNKERRRLVQRRNVLKELIDTEAVFVRDMNIVEEIYKGTAEACPKLDSKTVKLIFRNSDEIIDFHTTFLTQLKEAVVEVYSPKSQRVLTPREESTFSEASQSSSTDINDAKDRATSLGPVFQSNMEKMKLVHEGFLRNSDHAAKRLIQIQQDSTVNVWLNECNEVAKDLTAAWDLDSLLIKPMQRITKYPNLIMTLLQHTPQDHPDREALVAAKDALEEAIIEINKTKKNFELVGQIVGRKRKESDVKAGIARAFGKRVDKLQGSSNRPPEDPEYAKLEERFSDDYLRLQVVLRDVEFYTRQVSAYVHEFLQYLSAIELVMRLQPGNYPELESKWVQFNISIRDLEKVALEQHLAQVRKHVIEPFEQVIKAYGNPSLAMKKRQKRRMVWERSEQLKRAGKTIDPKLKELVEQYEALNETLIKELPKLSALTEKVGHICLGNLINIQTNWYGIWKEKMKPVLNDSVEMPDIEEIVATFQRDFPYAHEQLASISIISQESWRRVSQSTTSGDDGMLKAARPRPSESDNRGRCLSINDETAPVLPAPDFGQRNSESFAVSSNANANANANALASGGAPSPRQYNFREYYTSYQPSLASPRSVEVSGSSRSLMGTGQTSTRPSTGRSFDSGAIPRRSTESAPQTRRDSSATFNSMYQAPESGRFSNMFHSALPLPDGPEESQLSSRASSRERSFGVDGYNILWLAASLFEFNIETTKHEAGYPYLTYQAGEIFDVIGEKGELWLAKNQDDPTDQVGWIWSKHFAKLADS